MTFDLCAADPSTVDAFCTSGPSPTQAARIHLLGVGAVGRAYLSLGGPDVVVGCSDSQGTALDPTGLPILAILRDKGRGRSLVRTPECLHTWQDDIEPAAAAQIVLDATPTRLQQGPSDAIRIRTWLDRGQCVALASKHAVAADPTLLAHPRLGANAVLGGTGARLQAELALLQRNWERAALAGNASTTIIITCIEEGGTFADGLARAEAMGVLEPDPELDLKGRDAAVKLALIAGALSGVPHSVDDVDVQDLRSIAPGTLQATAKAGQTTRLVGRIERGGSLSLRYAALDRTDSLAVHPDAVVYRYELADGAHTHVGYGVGAVGTAKALCVDIERLRGEA
ncbi:MAG: hypothetical protein AAGA48_10155 [Myxococcota bacterium]